MSTSQNLHNPETIRGVEMPQVEKVEKAVDKDQSSATHPIVEEVIP
jgi:hypothetical protein